MSADVVTPLAAAFVASILTMIGSRWIAGYQSDKAAAQEKLRREHESAQAKLADQRSLRDGKRERLRADYVVVAYAADSILGASKELGVLWAEETVESRDERLNKLLTKATDDLRRATVRMKLEEGTKPLIDAYERVRGHWFQYQWQVPEATRSNDHSQVLATLLAIESEVQGIIATAKAHLDALSNPI